MEEDLISIIIPVYNAEQFMEETIKTIKAQTYSNWEAIFVDDASQDHSKAIIQQYKGDNIKLMELTRNSGPAMARNKGLEMAKGRYITYLDADDLWEQDKLEKQYKFMKQHDYAFTYTGYRQIKKNGTIGKTVRIQEELDYTEALKKIRILPITAMIDVKKIPKDLLIMPNLDLAEDIVTWWKILKKGYMAYGIKEPLAFYRKSKNTRSANKIKSMKQRWFLYRKIERISLLRSVYYYLHYVLNAILRRI